MSRAKEAKGCQGKKRKSSAPVAGPTDPKRSAQDPMADPLEMRMKGESHQM
ncbi:hypothetical protein ACTQ4E_05225 [Lawsonibacter sp. LCP25S3_G6]|uniref:hypothetical protein n=1 Tax=unclassified Lawsonibacter TaxID=2617946 RepID=UPI003F96FDC8